jgi:hopanoid-associated phosphorylase
MNVAVADQRLPILVVTGMAKEMRLAAGPGLVAVVSGGNSAGLRQRLADRVAPGCRAVLSFGLAGGLDPHLTPGDVIVASGVVANGQRWLAHAAVAESLASSLTAGGVRTRVAEIAGVDAPVLNASDKAAIRAETGAAAVDMESHVAAAFAARHGLIFAALRIVCDPASRTLPPIVANALRANGGIDHLAMLGSLLRQPTQLAALTRIAGEARTGFRALGRCRDLLGIGRRQPNFLELFGDVA